MANADPFVSKMRRWMEVFMHHSMRNFIRYAKEQGLSLSQCGALFHLHHESTAGVTDLGDHLGVSSAAASQMLERLVQQDLILRSEDPSDRRVKQIALTPKGCRVIEEGMRARECWLVDLAEKLSSDEKDQILNALDSLIDKASHLGHPIQPEF